MCAQGVEDVDRGGLGELMGTKASACGFVQLINLCPGISRACACSVLKSVRPGWGAELSWLTIFAAQDAGPQTEAEAPKSARSARSGPDQRA